MKKYLTLNNLILVLCVAGMILAMYLSYIKLTSSHIYCRFGECDKVQNSQYASLYGIPVALFGVLYYFAQFTFAYKNFKKLEYVGLGWGLLFSSYLTYLELYVIHAICMWCVVSFALIISMTVIRAVQHFTKPKNENIVSL